MSSAGVTTHWTPSTHTPPTRGDVDGDGVAVALADDDAVPVGVTVAVSLADADALDDGVAVSDGDADGDAVLDGHGTTTAARRM